MSFLKHSIIQNQKPIYRLDGRCFGKGLLWQVLHINDWHNTMIVRLLNTRSKVGIGSIRLEPDSDTIKSFSDVTGQF